MTLDATCLRFVVDAALEFRSVRAEPASSVVATGAVERRAVHSVVDVEIEGVHWEDVDVDSDVVEIPLHVGVELHRSGVDRDETTAAQRFEFVSKCSWNTIVQLGPRLAGVRVTVPCVLSVGHASDMDEIEMTAPVWLSAREIRLDSKRLSLHPQWGGEARSDAELVAECSILSADQLHEIGNGGRCELVISTNSEVYYPIVSYVRRRNPAPADPDIAQKFLRMKRILLEFRSHSRGALARFCGKIESPRVLKNDVGELVKDGLLRDGIMYKEGNFYFLNTDRLHEVLDISWPDLRRGSSSEKMMQYLMNDIRFPE